MSPGVGEAINLGSLMVQADVVDLRPSNIAESFPWRIDGRNCTTSIGSEMVRARRHRQGQHDTCECRISVCRDLPPAAVLSTPSGSLVSDTLRTDVSLRFH